jgi:hypothetical protein
LGAKPGGTASFAADALRTIRLGEMLDPASSILCAFLLAAGTPRPSARHSELCGITLGAKGKKDDLRAVLRAARRRLWVAENQSSLLRLEDLPPILE